MNKYEKRFFIFDIVWTFGIFSGIIIFFRIYPIITSILFAALFLSIYIWFRKRVWNSLEKKEMMDVIAASS